MDNLQIMAHIAAQKDNKSNMHILWEKIEALNKSVGLSESTMKELQAKISSKIAACERSIRDHEKLL